jgi:peptidoglycan/xylan/chitin deacetylase (PgdA/CDA1 family)
MSPQASDVRQPSFEDFHPGSGRRLPLRGAWKRLSSGGGILCFHGITSPEMPGEGPVHVERSVFRAIVTLLTRLGHTVPLHDLLERHRSETDTSGLFSLTFDDAYAGIEADLRWLSAIQVPATVFVVLEASKQGRSFWWDRIDDIHPRCTVDRWEQFEIALGLPGDFKKGQPREFGPLRPLRQWLLAEFKGRWPGELEAELDLLEGEVGYHTAQRAMDFVELSRCAKLPGIDFGIHTVTHPVLPLLSTDELSDEIRACHAHLSDSLPNVVPILAAPFGLFDKQTVQVALESGMTACLSVQEHLLGSDSTAALPRLLIRRQEKRWKLAMRLLGVGRSRFSRSSAYPPLPSAVT